MLHNRSPILLACIVFSVLAGCHASEPAFVGTWKRPNRKGGQIIITIVYKPDGTWISTNSKNSETLQGTWKADGQTLNLTGTVTDSLQWRVSEEGKHLTTTKANQRDVIWDRE